LEKKDNRDYLSQPWLRQQIATDYIFTLLWFYHRVVVITK